MLAIIISVIIVFFIFCSIADAIDRKTGPYSGVIGRMLAPIIVPILGPIALILIVLIALAILGAF